MIIKKYKTKKKNLELNFNIEDDDDIKREYIIRI